MNSKDKLQLLTGIFSRQTNNIVGIQSYYVILFTTSTTGTIKFIDITFPPGIGIGATPQVIEREGIGAGTAAKTSNTQIRYTVNNAVNVPAGTQIKLECISLVNPTLPDSDYKVSVTTRNSGEGIIGGPTQSNPITMQQIGTGQIAENSVTSEKIADGAIQPQVIPRFGDSVSVLPGFFSNGIAFCLTGEVPVSGGAFVSSSGAGQLTITNQAITTAANGWFTEMFNSDPTNSDSFTPSATCMPAMP